MQYQVFVKSRSDRGFTASVLEMPSIAANGNTEGEAISNVKTELESQLSTGKIVTNSIEPKTNSTPMQYAGILETDPTFDDLMEKLVNIRQVANECEDGI